MGALPRRAMLRSLSTFMLALYVLATVAVPVAHALLPVDRAPVTAHVESQGDQDHKPVHQESNCPVIWAAGLLAAPAVVARLQDRSPVRVIALPPSHGVAFSRAGFTPYGPRAPPLA